MLACVASVKTGVHRPSVPSAQAANYLFLRFAESIRPRVERRLRQRLSAELRSSKLLGPQAVSVCRALVDVCLRGGKRSRAALVAVGGRCFGRQSNDALLLEIGAAVEVLHTYFLVHDDWIDGDLVRRGGPSAHAQLRQLYGTALGDAAGVLAGDWGSVVANQWMTSLTLPQRRLTKVLAVFAAMQRAAIGGQLRDLLATDSRIEQTYRLKTASYTVEGPLALGALASGAGPRELDVIRKFAEPTGVAFQLRDDLIGLFASPKQTGKPFGSDLRAGKRTAVASHALRVAKGTDKRVIVRAFGNPTATALELREAVRSIDRVGSRSYVESRIDQLIATACGHLDSTRVTDEARALLTSAAFTLALRSR